MRINLAEKIKRFFKKKNNTSDDISSLENDLEQINKIHEHALENVKNQTSNEEILEEDSIPQIEELISSKILNYDEKYSILNGGFVQYEKIKEFILNDINIEDDDLLKNTLQHLQDLKLIHSTLELENGSFYLFKPLEFTDEELRFISAALNRSPLTKEELSSILEWNEDQVLAIMKKLQEKGILRIEFDKIIIPGINQKIAPN